MYYLIHLNATPNFKEKGKNKLVQSQVNSFSTLLLFDSKFELSY